MVNIDPAQKELRMFRYILKECIKGKLPQFKENLNQIFFETKSLVAKEKNYYQIDRDYYNLIVYLSKKEPDYFKTVNKPDKKFYKKMSEWMSDSAAVNAFDAGFTKHFC
jgi:hypothetical protein